MDWIIFVSALAAAKHGDCRSPELAQYRHTRRNHLLHHCHSPDGSRGPVLLSWETSMSCSCQSFSHHPITANCFSQRITNRRTVGHDNVYVRMSPCVSTAVEGGRFLCTFGVPERRRRPRQVSTFSDCNYSVMLSLVDMVVLVRPLAGNCKSV